MTKVPKAETLPGRPQAVQTPRNGRRVIALLDAAPPPWLLLGGVALAAYGLLSAMPYQTDAQGHHLISRFAWRHPHLFPDPWNRPLYTVVTALPASLGWRAAERPRAAAPARRRDTQA